MMQSSARTGKTILIPKTVFGERFPRAWEYLKENYDTLRDREKGKMRREGWYGYVYPKSVSLFARKKILTPSIASSAAYTLDERGELYFVGSGGGGGGGYGIILREDGQLSYEYVLGLLNSRLLDDYLKQISTPYPGDTLHTVVNTSNNSPSAPSTSPTGTDVPRHDRMVALVEAMLDLHRKLAATVTDQEKTVLQRQIVATDRQIDRLVYKLYGLTEAEIGIVEIGGAG